MINILALLLFFSQSHAETIFDASSCVAVLGRAFSLRELSFGPPQYDKSVAVIAQQAGAAGHPEYVLKKTGGSWRSAFAPEIAENGSQGDPRSFAQVLGPELAHYFGIRAINKTTMLVPHTDAINANIDSLNEKLRENGSQEIAVRFYMTAEALESDETYNAKFAADGAFPISADLDLFVHDVSFHLASVIMPRRFVEHTKYVAGIVNLFLKELKPTIEEGTARERLIKKWSHSQLLGNQSRLIDFAYGNFIGALRLRNEKSVDPDLYEFLLDTNDKTFHMFFTANGPNHLEAILLGRIDSMFGRSAYNSLEGEPVSEEEMQDVMKTEVRKFISRHPEIDWRKELPRYSSEKLAEQALRYIKDLKEAAFEN